MTSALETLLKSAIRKVTDDYTREDLSPLEEAHRDLLRAGLAWVYDYEMDPLVYEDGRVASPDRMFKITPEGRAIIDLAHALLGSDTRREEQ